LSNGSIALAGGEVKRTFAPSSRDKRSGVLPRPDVLQKMPLSCSVVFDVLRSLAMGEATAISVSELSVMCRLSHRQVRRILTRLHGAHLIYWRRGGPGRCHPSTIEVLWKSPAQMARNRLHREGDISTPSPPPRRPKETASAGPAGFPQKKGAPRECPSERGPGTSYPYSQRFRFFSHSDPCSQLSNRAHRWAMAKLRDAVRACPVPWPRRNRLLEAMGLALWRAIARGEVRTSEELARLVRRLRAALWGEGLPQEAKALHAWAGWKVRQVLQELERERLALLASEELVARIRQEREEARRAWQEVRAGVADDANHSNRPCGLIAHPEGSLEIDAVPQVSTAECSSGAGGLW